MARIYLRQTATVVAQPKPAAKVKAVKKDPNARLTMPDALRNLRKFTYRERCEIGDLLRFIGNVKVYDGTDSRYPYFNYRKLSLSDLRDVKRGMDRCSILIAAQQ